MATPHQIRVLIIEDSEEDVALLLHELKKGGYDPIHQRVETRETLQAALKNQDWDIVLSDYTMPDFGGTEALSVVKKTGRDIPFIFVSGTIGEDRAVAAVKSGANDYIIKGQYKRLIPALERELREAEVRRQRKIAEEALRESNQTLQALFRSSPLAIIVIDPAGHVRMWNPASEHIFGWSEKEVLGMPIPIVPPDRKKEAEENRNAALRGKQFISVELRHQKKNGDIIHTSSSTALLSDQTGEVSGIIAVVADITEHKRSEATINHMAYHDTLTDLANRTLFRDRLQQAILAAPQAGKAAGLLLIDFDRFREINDTLGHQRGDLLLKQIGPRLREGLTESYLIARFGGDEFAVLLPNVDAKDAAYVASKIIKLMEKPFFVEEMPIMIEPSIGIALSPDHGENPDSLIQRADIAMYVAKEKKKGYAFYSSEIDRHSPRRLALLGELRNAIDTNQLFLLYQPKVLLKTGRITGVEALVRWRHPEYGIVSPDQFISIAEHSGLIKPLTLWVTRAALHQARAWHQEGKSLHVAVNLSARNLEDAHLPGQIAEMLNTFGVAASSLELEITESALMENPALAMNVLTRLSSMGIQLSIDDFGTGYSSLGYLKRLPVNRIKIDRSFVKEMARDEDDAMIVRSTIELTHNLSLKVVAEGVEDQETFGKLAGLGCDAAQGYYISRPIPAHELNNWFQDTAPLKGWTLGGDPAR